MGLKNSLRHTRSWSYLVWRKRCVCEGHNCTCDCVLTCSLFIIYCIKCEMFHPASCFTSHIVLRIVLGPGRNVACPGTSGTTYLCDRKNYIVFFPSIITTCSRKSFLNEGFTASKEVRYWHLLSSLIAGDFHDTLLNPLNPELNPICYLLALLGAHHFHHVSRVRVKLTFRLLMSYI